MKTCIMYLCAMLVMSLVTRPIQIPHHIGPIFQHWCIISAFCGKRGMPVVILALLLVIPYGARDVSGQQEKLLLQYVRNIATDVKTIMRQQVQTQFDIKSILRNQVNTQSDIKSILRMMIEERKNRTFRGMNRYDIIVHVIVVQIS